MRIGHVFNPAAHGFADRARREGYLAVIRRMGAVAIAGPSEGTVDPQRLSDQMAGLDVVIVAGGDGTVNRCLPALVATGVPLLPFPAGTVNDLASRLSITSQPEHLPELVEAGTRRTLGLGAANGRLFSTYATLGIGARAAAWRLRHRRALAVVRRIAPRATGPIATLAAIASGGPALRPDIRALSADPVAAIYVCALDRLNRTIRVGRDEGLDRGALDVLAVAEASPLALARTLAAALGSGDLRRPPTGCTHLTVQTLAVGAEGGGELALYGDGEPLGKAARLVFEVRAGALTVIAPAAGPPPHAASGSSTAG